MVFKNLVHYLKTSPRLYQTEYSEGEKCNSAQMQWVLPSQRDRILHLLSLNAMKFLSPFSTYMNGHPTFNSSLWPGVICKAKTFQRTWNLSTTQLLHCRYCRRYTWTSFENPFCLKLLQHWKADNLLAVCIPTSILPWNLSWDLTSCQDKGGRALAALSFRSDVQSSQPPCCNENRAQSFLKGTVRQV